MLSITSNGMSRKECGRPLAVIALTWSELERNVGIGGSKVVYIVNRYVGCFFI